MITLTVLLPSTLLCLFAKLVCQGEKAAVSPPQAESGRAHRSAMLAHFPLYTSLIHQSSSFMHAQFRFTKLGGLGDDETSIIAAAIAGHSLAIEGGFQNSPFQLMEPLLS